MNRRARTWGGHFLTVEESKILKNKDAYFINNTVLPSKRRKVSGARKRECNLKWKISGSSLNVNEFLSDLNLILEVLPDLKPKYFSKEDVKKIKTSIIKQLSQALMGEREHLIERPYPPTVEFVSDDSEKDYRLICRLGKKIRSNASWKRLFLELMDGRVKQSRRNSLMLRGTDYLESKGGYVRKIEDKGKKYLELNIRGKNMLEQFGAAWGYTPKKKVKRAKALKPSSLTNR